MYIRKFDHHIWRYLLHPIARGNTIAFIWVKDRCTELDHFTWNDIDKVTKIRWATSARCKKCYNCKMNRSSKIVARSMSKFKQLKVKSVFLWTFGTSLDDTPSNILKIKSYWRKFTQRFAMKKLRKGISYFPLFKVIEAGTKGRKLHIHAIFAKFFEHSPEFLKSEGICKKSCVHALCTWRQITGENSNVQYQGNRYSKPVTAFFYCVKYAVKENSSYSYLGEMLKVPFRDKDWKFKDSGQNTRGQKYTDFEEL